jgi:hypothetical protein
MDEVLRWVAHIPQARAVLRRIVLLRAQTNFASGRPTPWAAVGREVGADAKAVKTWHETAIALIIRGLHQRGIVPPAASRG